MPRPAMPVQTAGLARADDATRAGDGLTLQRHFGNVSAQREPETRQRHGIHRCRVMGW